MSGLATTETIKGHYRIKPSHRPMASSETSIATNTTLSRSLSRPRHKAGWPTLLETANIPFATVSFLSRKKRLHEIEPFIYVIICRETEYALACSSTEIFKDDFVEELNLTHHERRGKDVFYRVPKEKCYFFKV